MLRPATPSEVRAILAAATSIARIVAQVAQDVNRPGPRKRYLAEFGWRGIMKDKAMEILLIVLEWLAVRLDFGLVPLEVAEAVSDAPIWYEPGA